MPEASLPPRSSSDRHLDTNPAQLLSRDRAGRPGAGHRGAGSGKTRTIVHRLAWLAEQGVPASDMLLLSRLPPAARPAAKCRLGHGSAWLQHRRRVHGGTFHSFALLGAAPVLGPHGPKARSRSWTRRIKRLGHPAVQGTAQSVRATARSPKTQTIIGLLSKARTRKFYRRRAPARRAAPVAPMPMRAGKHRRGIPGLPPPARLLGLRRPAVRARTSDLNLNPKPNHP